MILHLQKFYTSTIVTLQGAVMGIAAPPCQSYDVRILFMLNDPNTPFNQNIIARQKMFVNI